jgi:hypothetical protein
MTLILNASLSISSSIAHISSPVYENTHQSSFYDMTQVNNSAVPTSPHTVPLNEAK